MANHVINEIIFNLEPGNQRERILKAVTKNEKDVDFSILIPPPLNVYHGLDGIREEKIFKTWSKWQSENWGTKWNAYNSIIERKENVLRIEFKTEWAPPAPWACALYNKFGFKFLHSWMSELNDDSMLDKWGYYKEGPEYRPWTRELITEETEKRRLHKLLWGVEEFEEEEDKS